MTHAQAMRQRHAPDPRDPDPACQAELIDPNHYFADDGSWTACTCPRCKVAIATVEGRVHWWNSVVTPTPARAARMAAL